MDFLLSIPVWLWTLLIVVISVALPTAIILKIVQFFAGSVRKTIRAFAGR